MNKCPRILFLTSSFPVPGYPASGIFIYQLARHLDKKCTLEILAPDSNKFSDGGLSDKNDKLHITLFRYAPRAFQTLFHIPGGLPEALHRSRLATILLPVALVAMLYRVFRLSRKTDLIHTNWSLPSAIAIFAAMFSRKPVISTFRGSDISFASSSIFAKQLIRICIRFCAQIVCVNKVQQQELIARYNCPREKVSVIQNGVAAEFSGLPLRNKYRVPINFIVIGNLTKNKSVDVILSALSRLKDSQFHLAVVGTGPEGTYLKELSVKLGLAEKVTFLGQCHPDIIPKLLDDADVLIFSSQSEGRPNVLLEAMAAGKTIIASNIHGVSDLITDNDTGLLYSCGNISELQKRILFVMENEEFSLQLGHRARKFITSSGLTWDQCAEQYLELYKKVAPDCCHNSE